MERGLSLHIAAQRRTLLTLAMRQSLEILQMPQVELGKWLEAEIEKNPLLELTQSTRKTPSGFWEIPAKQSLAEHLSSQIRDQFEGAEVPFALKMIENLDERGFLPENLPVDEKILKTLQTFDPPGIFARNVRECFLLQLARRKLKNTKAFIIIEKHFEDLLQKRYGKLKKALQLDSLVPIFTLLRTLSMRPAAQFSIEPVLQIRVDLTLSKMENGWSLELNEEDIPPIQFNQAYFSFSPKDKEEKMAIRDFKTQAKWITRSLNRRKKLLLEIGELFIKKQGGYLEGKQDLEPLTMKEVAEELHIHESTLSRALSNKYAMTPRGVIALKALIPHSLHNHELKNLIEKTIREEDKNHPMTDEKIRAHLKLKGFSIPRRTIAKYRNLLKIGSAKERKNS